MSPRSTHPAPPAARGLGLPHDASRIPAFRYDLDCLHDSLLDALIEELEAEGMLDELTAPRLSLDGGHDASGDQYSVLGVAEGESLHGKRSLHLAALDPYAATIEVWTLELAGNPSAAEVEQSIASGTFDPARIKTPRLPVTWGAQHYDLFDTAALLHTLRRSLPRKPGLRRFSRDLWEQRADGLRALENRYLREASAEDLPYFFRRIAKRDPLRALQVLGQVPEERKWGLTPEDLAPLLTAESADVRIQAIALLGQCRPPSAEEMKAPETMDAAGALSHQAQEDVVRPVPVAARIAVRR
jgi:hypothetical protein